MRINAAVTLVLLMLLVVAGWMVAGSANPRTVTLFIGVAIGLIAGAPLHFLLALGVWIMLPRPASAGLGETGAGTTLPVVSAPDPVVIVMSPSDLGARRHWRVAGEIDNDPPHMLGGY